tara:strand:- start:20528 stop:22144 length:1617 start_codon:yes stop_codon:yes gene_type:complete
MSIFNNNTNLFFLSLLLVFTDLYAINKIPVSGTIQDVNGIVLSDALITLSRQGNSAISNRFGEFDLGQIFPNDTIYVVIEGFQKKQFRPSVNMKIKLFPKSVIQDKINNLRNGETLIIPPGIHFVYPDFNIDSTFGLLISNKSNVIITGSKKSEIRLLKKDADIFRIFKSNNIQIKNLTISFENLESSTKDLNINQNQAIDFPEALILAKNKFGENSFFKYDGLLHHTKGFHEPFIEHGLANVVKIVNSTNISMDNITFRGYGNICLSSLSSRNILINNSVINNGIYGTVFKDCENVKISKSLITDNVELYYHNNSQVNYVSNTIKILGYFVPELIFVEGGSIEMLDEYILPPPKPTYLSSESFKMSIKEITFDQYDSFCIATNKGFADDSEWGRGSRPVINISYRDAESYCKWLSNLTGKRVRLPSVIEWEFAARGGLKGGDDYAYSGNSLLEPVAWCKYNTNGKTELVGLKMPNELGLFDMSGNVFEYCSSMNDSIIVLKGGSWANSGVGCRVADEVVSSIKHWDDNIGFRIVQSE